MANGWKNYRKMYRLSDDEFPSFVWVHKTGVKSWRQLGYKLSKK